MQILAGDIGGTKTLLRLSSVDGSTTTKLREERFDSHAFSSFDDLLQKFLGKGEAISAACFAVAGPVSGNAASITNLSWTMSAPSLSAKFSIPRVSLVNDFFAVARGVPLMGEADLLSLNRGTRDLSAPIAILGAGTGLGEAFLLPEASGRWRVVPSEGGHADFAPSNETQSRLLAWLRSQHGHVSYERVCSGMGIAAIFHFMMEEAGEKVDESVSDLPAHVAAAAAAGDLIAIATLELFVDAYGAEAGSLALKVLARGGVYLAGGIAAKNLPRFTDGRFMKSFEQKGRFAPLMHEMPVDIIINPEVGLLGALAVAGEAAAT